MSGQSVKDRITAAKYSIAGQGLAKSVCKATTEEVIGPKKKHLDCMFIVVCFKHYVNILCCILFSKYLLVYAVAYYYSLNKMLVCRMCHYVSHASGSNVVVTYCVLI